MVAGALNQLASFATVAKVLIPTVIATGGLYYIQRHTWPLGRTIKEEWYNASEAYMMNTPRQGSPTPVRMNPFSDTINCHSITS